MSIFSIGIMLNSPSLFQKDRRQLKALNPPKLNNNTLGVITQSCNKHTEFLWVCANFPKIILFCQFHYRDDRERNGTFAEMCEALWKMYRYA